jgi:hypothetical protein
MSSKNVVINNPEVKEIIHSKMILPCLKLKKVKSFLERYNAPTLRSWFLIWKDKKACYQRMITKTQSKNSTKTQSELVELNDELLSLFFLDRLNTEDVDKIDEYGNPYVPSNMFEMIQVSEKDPTKIRRIDLLRSKLNKSENAEKKNTKNEISQNDLKSLYLENNIICPNEYIDDFIEKNFIGFPTFDVPKNISNLKLLLNTQATHFKFNVEDGFKQIEWSANDYII